MVILGTTILVLQENIHIRFDSVFMAFLGYTVQQAIQAIWLGLSLSSNLEMMYESGHILQAPLGLLNSFFQLHIYRSFWK